jgi:ubiquinone biosynthesis monooxygenase Coq7
MVLDELISEFDRGLRSLTGISRMSRPVPVPAQPPAAELTPAERTHAAGLMRVNHVGEVCAGALSGAEVHRAHRLREGDVRGSRARGRGPSRMDRAPPEGARLAPEPLNPLWYAGALAIGVAAGTLGDKVSLGFMAETERQVENHLEGHLSELPAADTASRAIVDQMRIDEVKHGKAATDAGGVELPLPARMLMRAASKVMTSTAYYL